MIYYCVGMNDNNIYFNHSKIIFNNNNNASLSYFPVYLFLHFLLELDFACHA